MLANLLASWYVAPGSLQWSLLYATAYCQGQLNSVVGSVHIFAGARGRLSKMCRHVQVHRTETLPKIADFVLEKMEEVCKKKS